MNKYLAIFQTTLINSLAYPGELVGRSLMILPFMWIFYQLWRVTFVASGTDTINSLTLLDTMWYLMMAETIELSRPRVARTIADNVKDGSIAYLLNKPYDFLVYQFSVSMGETIFRALMTAIFGGVMVWWLAGTPPSLLNWPLALITMIGAWVLSFLVSGMIGLAAFISEEVAPFEWIYQKFAFIFGGLLIPLDFYPQWLQKIAFALPFPAMTYGPSRLFVSPDASLFVSVLGQQAVWIMILGTLLFFAYRRGLAYLTVNGG
jgi:viologen exporter family transport system permease protein